MGGLIYSPIPSLGGSVETPDHRPAGSCAHDELHDWFSNRYRSIAASLYGRRLYELMSASWPFVQDNPDATDAHREFGRHWLETPKIVFSHTLESVQWNSRLVQGDVGEQLARVREEFDGDLEVAGPNLAAQFVRRGLVDRYEVLVHPVILGGGTPYLPPVDAPIRLRHTDTHVLGSGVTVLGYDAL